jgi:hypothetical protein
MKAKETIEEKVNKAKEKEKLKKEINKIKDKSKKSKKEILTSVSISDFTEIKDNTTNINEQDLLLLKIKEKEDNFLLTYFNENIKPTKVFTYNYDKSFIEYKIEDIIIISKEKPITRNNITPAQNIKLEKYLDNSILTIENIYVILNYNKNIKLKYRFIDINNNMFMSFEKMKKSDFKFKTKN